MGSVTVMVSVMGFGANTKETRSLHCRNNRAVNGRSEEGGVVVFRDELVDVEKKVGKLAGTLSIG